MFPCNGKHSINRTALPERTAPSPTCHSMWKSAWAIKQNPSFCLYLKFPLVFFSHTMWCWAEPVSVDCEWHMRIAGRDAVLVLFALFFCKQQFFLQHASKSASTEPGNGRLQQKYGVTKVPFILVPLIAIPHSFEADLWDTISSSPRGLLKPLKHTVLVSANTSPTCWAHPVRGPKFLWYDTWLFACELVAHITNNSICKEKGSHPLCFPC